MGGRTAVRWHGSSFLIKGRAWQYFYLGSVSEASNSKFRKIC